MNRPGAQMIKKGKEMYTSGTIRRKELALILVLAMLAALFAGCGTKKEEGPKAVDDGRARPSVCGKLQVKDLKLCSEDGSPVMLRGVSSHELITSEPFLTEELFRELSEDYGINLFRFAVYTYGMGIVGYCSGGSEERYKEDVEKGVELAKAHDMYAIIDWHVLSEGDPNKYADEAESFFSEMAEKYKGYNNVIYEICNEPNGVDWAGVKAYAERIIPVIREKDPDALIIVGNPDWSKDLYSAFADPLEFDNIMYTFHFYAASHKEEYMETVGTMSKGLPIFVTEYGVTASNGGYPRDLESADKWIELLEKDHISYCMWSFSKVAEACSAVKPSALKYSGYERDDFSETGQWLMDTIAKYNTK